MRWVLSLDPPGVRNLYATYSNVTALPPAERARLLDSLQSVAASQFAGRVERNMTTAIYTARRSQDSPTPAIKRPEAGMGFQH